MNKRIHIDEVIKEDSHSIKVTTHLDHAYLVEFSYSSGYATERSCVLWGIVEQDNRGWLMKGDYVCTSRILEFLSDTLYRSLNSVYAVKTPPDKIALPLSSLPALRRGTNPILLTLDENDFRRRQHEPRDIRIGENR